MRIEGYLRNLKFNYYNLRSIQESLSFKKKIYRLNIVLFLKHTGKMVELTGLNEPVKSNQKFLKIHSEIIKLKKYSLFSVIS